MWLPKGKQFQPCSPTYSRQDVVMLDTVEFGQVPLRLKMWRVTGVLLETFPFLRQLWGLNGRMHAAYNTVPGMVTTWESWSLVAGEACDWWMHSVLLSFSEYDGPESLWHQVCTWPYLVNTLDRGVQFQGVWGRGTWVGWRQMSWWIRLEKWNT